MHAVQEDFLGFLSAEKLIEDGSIGAKHLLPTWSTLANGILEMMPEPKQDVVGIKDVTGEGLLTGAAEISAGDRFVFVDIQITAKKLQIYANVEQALKRLGFESKRGGEAEVVAGNVLEEIENAERNSGKHHFRAAKGFNEIEDGSGIHGVHSCLHQDKRRVRRGRRETILASTNSGRCTSPRLRCCQFDLVSGFFSVGNTTEPGIRFRPLKLVAEPFQNRSHYVLLAVLIAARAHAEGHDGVDLLFNFLNQVDDLLYAINSNFDFNNRGENFLVEHVGAQSSC